MTVQRIDGAFRTASGSNQNCGDNVSFGSTTATWTGGDTIIDSLGAFGINPIATPRWEILGLSVAANLQGLASAISGKIGKIFAGLILGSSPTSGASNSPDQRYVLPLPADSSIISTLWDPAVDEFPPASNAAQLSFNPSAPPSLNASCQILPPQPLAVDPNIPIGVGIWLQPSLISGQSGANFQLSVLAARYSLIYDDGVA